MAAFSRIGLSRLLGQRFCGIFGKDALQVSITNSQGKRLLFSNEYLGLDNYKRQKAVTADRVGSGRASFFEKLDQYLKESKENVIFTDDLKTAIYLAETDNEINIVDNMLIRYSQDSNSMLSNFIFGPVVMRLLHSTNKPDIAISLFENKSLDGFFDQFTSYSVYMDLMYSNKRYEKIIEAMDFITQKNLKGLKYPVDCITLLAASCYKLNTPEALQKMMTTLADAKKHGCDTSLRTIVYSAMLAHNVKNPKLAYELLSLVTVKQESRLPVAYLNAKVSVLTELGRYEEAVNLLKSIVHADIPDKAPKDIFEEMLTKLNKKLEETSNKTLLAQVKKIETDLKGSGKLISFPFEQYLDSEIQKTKKQQEGFKQRERTPVGGLRKGPKGIKESLNKPSTVEKTAPKNL